MISPDLPPISPDLPRQINAKMGVHANAFGHMGVACQAAAEASDDARALLAAGARVASARHMGVARAE